MTGNRVSSLVSSPREPKLKLRSSAATAATSANRPNEILMVLFLATMPHEVSPGGPTPDNDQPAHAGECARRHVGTSSRSGCAPWSLRRCASGAWAHE